MPDNKKIIFVTNPRDKISGLDLSTAEGRAVDRLKKQYESKGLKNIDISILLGWQTPKTSKILNGRQTARVEDITELAYGICSDAEPFMQDIVNLTEYDRQREFQTLNELIKELCQPNMFTDIDILMRRDFPYVMCKTAGLEPTRFVKRGSANISPDIYDKDIQSAPEVYMYDRTVSFDNGETIPIIGYWVDLSYQILILAVCVVSKNGMLELGGITNIKREHYKGLLDVDEQQTNDFENITRQYQRLSRKLVSGEIVSVVYSLKDGVPTDERLDSDFNCCVSQYARLIKEVTGEAPNFGSDISTYDLSSFDITKIIESVEKSVGVGYLEEAKKKANYRCFFDDEKGTHETFLTEGGVPYIVCEMIVPIEATAEYKGKTFIAENIVCLCPMCDAKLKYAQKDEREDMLWKIYRKRRDELRDNGIEISSGKLMNLWNI